ncbi:MAG: ribosome maturation factor RimM [Oscillospiraceae bacterium]|nr:ribosome maturation factor RimM [Oscillospiraceae bacterium]MDE7171083.1 ribosome maturation factor RimM [Oscillospiraceae bacterium]
MNEFLDCGQIVNTHGIHGEVRIVPWADSPEFLRRFSTLYADGIPIRVMSSRVHKGSVIAKLDGVDTVEQAMLLKGKTVQIRRTDAKLPEGSFFLADIIGLPVVDESGQKLGVLREVLSPSVQQVYVVDGQREIMIPAVPEFILETNIADGYIKVRLIEGM